MEAQSRSSQTQIQINFKNLDYFCPMGKIRSSFVSRIIAVVTGLIFLNMSFFLSEIRLLKLDVSNSTLVENIVKMISGVGFEEEKDSMSESGETSGGETIIDFHLPHESLLPSNGYLIFHNRSSGQLAQFVSTSYTDIATPPPRIA